MSQKGVFITVEGIEGSGKSTQSSKLKDYLTEKGHTVVFTREPGGTEVGEKLRDLILNPNYTFKSKYTELFLFYADRLEHVECVIKPALDKGHIVICDRYIDSTIAYQVGARGISLDLIQTLSDCVNLMPSLTLLYDLDVSEGLARAKARSAPDRFEKEALAFHENVRNEYLKISKREPNRVKILKANRDIDTIFEETKTIVNQFFKNK